MQKMLDLLILPCIWERIEGHITEMVDVKWTKAIPNFPHDELVLDIGTDHPGSIRVKVTVEERDRRDIREMTGVR